MQMLTPDPLENRAYFSRETTTTTPLPPTKTAAVGHIVNYVLPSGRNAGEIRPAIIVRTWSPTTVQLQVFTDSYNDYSHEHTGSTGTLWATSVLYSESKMPGTWHWSEDATQFPVIEATTL